MVPHKGLRSIHQYRKSKTTNFGYKIWRLSGNDGYSCHLDIYCGNEFDLGGKVVLEMVNVLQDMKDDDITNCEFFFDNYFTSYKLMEKLSDYTILGTATVKENTISRIDQIVESKNALKNKKRGTYGFFCAESIF